MASGLEIDEFQFLFGTPCTPEGAADSDAPRTPPGQGRIRSDSLGGSDSSLFERSRRPRTYIECEQMDGHGDVCGGLRLSCSTRVDASKKANIEHRVCNISVVTVFLRSVALLGAVFLNDYTLFCASGHSFY